MTDPNWQAIAQKLATVARGCTCEYERTKPGVPMWFPDSAGGIGRKLIKQCSRCAALDEFKAAAKVAA